MSKKVIKLINNEHENSKVALKKACDATSVDICTYIDTGNCTKHAEDRCQKDYDGCSAYAVDVCSTDYASCEKGATDYCSAMDLEACTGAGAEDII